MSTGIRISQLPTITGLTDDDILIVNDGDVSTRKITYANFKSAISSDINTVTSVNGLTGNVTINATTLGVYTTQQVDDLVVTKASNALLGVVNGSDDLGTFAGNIIPSDTNVRDALQTLENAIEAGDASDAILNGNNTFSGTNVFNGTVTAAQNGNVIPFYFADQASFPSAATYHGAVAHSHADGKMYFAHGGGWVALANDSDVFSGQYAELTGAPTLGTASAEDVGYFATAAQGTTADNALPASSVSTFGGTLIDDADAAAARTTLGLGTAAVAASADFATAAQGTTADAAIPLATLKTAAANSADYAAFQAAIAAL